jgi:RNA polymerase sigma factor (sigma-70 family)
VSHPADIDDVRQEANVAVLLAMRKYDPQRPLKPYLYACVYRHLSDWLRKRPTLRRQAFPKLRDRYKARRLGTSVDTNLIDLKHVACTWLTDEERVLLELLLSGQTAREIAGGRGCTRASIYDATRRLVRRLRSLLADLED